MQSISYSKIILSVGMIVFVAALAVAGTGAFFNDTETSTGNTFAAGDIDLQIDNESYALDFNIPGFVDPVGDLVANPANSWDLTDLEEGVHRFFDFTDVKPGDYGEDTISIHVGSNDAWLCAAAQVTDDSDQTCTEPELDDDPTCTDPNGDGELDEILQFAFWVDDGDNVYEPIESASNAGDGEVIFVGGDINEFAEDQIALADSLGGAFGNNPVPGGETVYIGKIWCAGQLSDTGLQQDGSGDTIDPTTDQGTGFTCDGTLVDNAVQTDQVVGDMQFYAVQARNNADFECSTGYTPTWPQT